LYAVQREATAWRYHGRIDLPVEPIRIDYCQLCYFVRVDQPMIAC